VPSTQGSAAPAGAARWLRSTGDAIHVGFGAWSPRRRCSCR